MFSTSRRGVCVARLSDWREKLKGLRIRRKTVEGYRLGAVAVESLIGLPVKGRRGEESRDKGRLGAEREKKSGRPLLFFLIKMKNESSISQR